MSGRRLPPPGMRWANGGGIGHIGECNGYHLAPEHQLGTLCGRYGPATITASMDSVICGNCARIAGVPRFDG